MGVTVLLQSNNNLESFSGLVAVNIEGIVW